MFSPLIKQIYASAGMNMLSFAWTFDLALVSIILPSLRQDNSDIKVTVEQESWISSVSILLLFPSQVIAGLLMDRYGRKYIFLFGFLTIFTSNVLVYFSNNYWSLISGLFLLGACGGSITMGGIYMAEFVSPRYRGALLISKAPCQCVGLIIAHFLGMYVHWRTLVIIGTLPTIVGFIIMSTCPESPTFLAIKGKFDECEKAFNWFRADGENDELHELLTFQKSKLITEKQNNEKQEWNFHHIKSYFLNRSFLRAFAISLACTVFIDGSGKQTFNILALDMIATIIGDNTNVFYYALGVDFCDFMATLLSCFFIKRFKRRLLLFKMAIPAITALLLFCLLSFLTSRGVIPKSLSWMTLFVIVVYFFIISSCITPVGFAIFSEVYPTSHKGTGLVFNALVFYSLLFAFTKMTPALLKSYEAHGTFMINVVMITCALICLYYLLPETGDRTLIDIENEMTDKNKQKLNDNEEVEAMTV